MVSEPSGGLWCRGDPVSDIDLLEAIGRDPQTGIGAVIDRYGGVLLARIRSRARERGYGNLNVEDVFMESLETLVEEENRAACIARGGEIVPWLTRLAYWRLEDAARKRSREGDQPLEEGQVPDSVCPPGEEPDTGNVGASALTRAFRRALPSLSPKDQEFLRLQFNESYSSRELAERFGITEGAVRKATHDARRRLEKLIEQELARTRGEDRD
jgi:RNA polymerase sigma factor (sigma-70 family)